MRDTLAVEPQGQAGIWPQSRRLIRVLLIVVHLAWGFLVALLIGAFWAPQRPRVLVAKQRWCQRFLRIIGARLTVTGTVQDGSVFLVSNHVSWLDIPVIASQRHLYFLSKAEVGNWPLIGHLARAVGTLFIQRGSGESGRKAGEITARLKQGHTVLVFPEGTTTEGTGLRRFFPQLFDAPLQAKVPLQPLAIRYLDNMGAPDPAMAFIGDDEFHHHLWAMLLRREVRVRLHFCEPIEAAGDRKGLCEQARDSIGKQLIMES